LDNRHGNQKARESNVYAATMQSTACTTLCSVAFFCSRERCIYFMQFALPALVCFQLLVVISLAKDVKSTDAPNTNLICPCSTFTQTCVWDIAERLSQLQCWLACIHLQNILLLPSTGILVYWLARATTERHAAAHRCRQ
jgi:hypothetical protein